MAIFVPDQAINNELQETVTRQSIRRMIQAGTNILTANSETQQNQVIAAAQQSGLQPSPNDPLLVWRTDTGVLAAYSGTSWTLLTPGMAINEQVSISMVGSYTASSLTMVRHGNVVFCDGYISAGTGTIAQGARSNIGVCPAGWRPSAYVYGSSFADSVVSWVNGSGSPYQGVSAIYINPSSGNLSVHAGVTSTQIIVSSHWRI